VALLIPVLWDAACVILLSKILKIKPINLLSICFEAIVNATHAFVHLTEQVPENQRRHGDFFGFVEPVHAYSTQGEVNDDEELFPYRAAMLCDNFRPYWLIYRLHQS
jgi:hypothetical protein